MSLTQARMEPPPAQGAVFVQHGWPWLPQWTQVPPVEHVVKPEQSRPDSQHGFPSSPQVSQMSFTQARMEPPPAQGAVFVQHGWPWLPQWTQVPPAEHVVKPEQSRPETQHGFPSIPQALQVPLMQARMEPPPAQGAVLVQHGWPLLPQWTQLPATHVAKPIHACPEVQHASPSSPQPRALTLAVMKATAKSRAILQRRVDIGNSLQNDEGHISSQSLISRRVISAVQKMTQPVFRE